jgi:hypothetical protein
LVICGTSRFILLLILRILQRWRDDIVGIIVHWKVFWRGRVEGIRWRLLPFDWRSFLLDLLLWLLDILILDQLLVLIVFSFLTLGLAVIVFGIFLKLTASRFNRFRQLRRVITWYRLISTIRVELLLLTSAIPSISRRLNGSLLLLHLLLTLHFLIFTTAIALISNLILVRIRFLIGLLLLPRDLLIVKLILVVRSHLFIVELNFVG